MADSPNATRASRLRSRLSLPLKVGCLFCVLASVSGIVAFFVLFKIYSLPSESMEPTLLRDGMVLVARRAYDGGRLPKAGDLTVFEMPASPSSDLAGTLSIKRVIGLPGQTVEVLAPEIKVDGRTVDTLAESGMGPHEWVRQKMGLSDKAALFFAGDKLFVDRAQTSMEKIGKRVELIPGQVLLDGAPLSEAFVNEDSDYEMARVTVPQDTFFALGDNRNRSLDSHVFGPLPLTALRGKVVQSFP